MSENQDFSFQCMAHGSNLNRGNCSANLKKIQDASIDVTKKLKAEQSEHHTTKNQLRLLSQNKDDLIRQNASLLQENKRLKEQLAAR